MLIDRMLNFIDKWELYICYNFHSFLDFVLRRKYNDLYSRLHKTKIS